MKSADLDENSDERRHAAASAAMLERSLTHAAVATHDDGGDALTCYPGGKNGAGVWQRLISMMPPHRVYCEAFLGSGAIIRRKRPADVNIGLDVDREIIAVHQRRKRDVGYWNFHCCDAVEWLRRMWSEDELIYADPPYLGDARLHPSRRCYAHEMKGEREHTALLDLLTSIPAMVMISGYRHPLYDEALASWRRVDYTAQTRGGPKPESVWCNFPEPTALHDYRFLGDDYHDRLRIKRKVATWVRRLGAMPALERAAVMAGIGATAG